MRSPGISRPALGQVVARNSLLNLIGLGAPLLIAVVAIPPILAGLGTERFGVLGLIWVGISYLALLDLGLGRATTRYAAAALGRGDERELGTIVVSAASFQLLLGVLGGGAAALAMPALVDSIAAISQGVEREALRAFTIMTIAAPIMTVTSSVRGLLEADQRFGWVNAVRLPISAANFVIPLVGVWIGLDLPQMVIGMVAMRALALAAFTVLCLRRWPRLLRRAVPSRSRMGDLLRFGGWVTVSALVGAVLVYADRLAVGAFVSIEAAGYYTVPHEVVTRLLILPSAMMLTLFPALAALSADDSQAQRRARVMARAQVVLLALVVPLLFGIAATAGDVLRLWLGADFAARAAAPLAILALGAAANSLAVVPHAALQASGRPATAARLHLLELPVHLLLLWWLVPRWGIIGAALTWSMRNALDATLQTAAAHRAGVAGGSGAAGLGAPMVVALGVLGGALAAASAIATRPVVAIVAVALVLLGWGVYAWRRVLAADERQRLAAAFGLRAAP